MEIKINKPKFIRDLEKWIVAIDIAIMQLESEKIKQRLLECIEFLETQKTEYIEDNYMNMCKFEY